MKFIYLENRLRFIPIPFKFGWANDTDATNAANERMNAATNETNRLIAEQNNLANYYNTQNTNASNIAMNEANNKLQIQLQREMNEYNSLSSQLERAEEAGVNPNAVISRLGGNVQTTLPSTQAGHADAPRSEIGAPMQPVRFENPYMERMARLEQFRNGINDFYARENISAQTDLSKAQAQNQYTINKYQDDLSALGVSMQRATLQKTYAETQYVVTQNKVAEETIPQIQASIAQMNEETRSKFLDNYFREEDYNSFLGNARKYLSDLGIPETEQLSDDDIKMFYFGSLNRLNIPLSQERLNIISSLETKANIGVLQSVRALNYAKSEKEVAETFIINTYGREQAKEDIENTKSDTRKKIAETKESYSRTNKNRQNFNIDRYKTSPVYQGYCIDQLSLQNLNIKANIENTRIRTARESQGLIGRGLSIPLVNNPKIR